ncbi:saposin b domain-containing protein [Stylonychia lemnae]|uniref:Saposin b domain-containing protein n=1 Tax=Stylonychia lemnae TaxID=5949 RepID=A0A077ZYT6_STYLE|nr:saposin b domain-containing protein [Stylonychia lemnae]|eukprot:CDW75116.1 saposin b domain-containing protein [Stylonychia lemnae]
MIDPKYKFLIAIFILLPLIGITQQNLSDDIHSNLAEETNFGILTSLENYIETHNLVLNNGQYSIQCLTCKFSLYWSWLIANNQLSRFILVKIISYVCTKVTPYDQYTCNGYVGSFADVGIDQLFKGPFNEKVICEDTYKMCPDTVVSRVKSIEQFQTSVLSDKPSNIANDQFINNIYTSIGSSARTTFKMLHLADLHLDTKYVLGASNTCNQIICCRSNHGFPSDTSKQAGQYGEFKCDSPLSLLVSMADYINNVIQPDMIIWTGDSMPHAEAQGMNFEEKKTTIDQINDLLLTKFANIPLYPSVGNHDYASTNFEDYTKKEQLYQYVSTDWSNWLDNDAMQLFLSKGYYKQKLKLRDGTTFNNVYMIALNTEVCYFYNFYLFSQRNDPAGMLSWLETTLKSFETNGQVAIMFGHIPPSGKDCMNGWSSRFKAITDRFQHIIRLTAYGHKHKEMVNLARSVAGDLPIGVHFSTSSVTPYGGVFEVDNQYFVPLKATTHYMDINAANPVWAARHELTNHYSLSNLSPAAFQDFANRVKTDSVLASKYLTSRSAGASPVSSCAQACRNQWYCYIREQTYYDYLDCMGQDKSVFFEGQFDWLFDPWFQL